MSTSISKRQLFSTGALSAGLGLGALALLPQRAEADTAFTGFSYPVGSGTVNRTTPARFADVVNVLEYGAKGDGATDDTAAIQAAFNAAFGPSSSPHGSSNPFLNKAVFFPGGNYLITA